MFSYTKVPAEKRDKDVEVELRQGNLWSLELPQFLACAIATVCLEVQFVVKDCQERWIRIACLVDIGNTARISPVEPP